MNLEKIIEKAKELIERNNGLGIKFTIEDNCPGDGWDGTLTEDGCYMFGNNHWRGEFYAFENEDEELTLWLEEIVSLCEEIVEANESISREVIFSTPKPPKLNIGKEAEYITDIYLSETKHPIAFKNKLEELVESGLSESEARNFITTTPFRLEIYYQKNCGLFAVESDACDCSKVYSPYTADEMEWSDNK